MYIVFPVRFNRLQWCNGYLASLPRWRPRFGSRGSKYFFVFNLIFSIFYIFCNKNLAAFFIKFNALAKSSHQPLSFFFFFFFFLFLYINFQIQTALSQLWLQICGYVIFFLVRILPNLCSHFFKSKFQNTPLKILVNFESGVHVFSGVLCRNAWNSAIHLFIICFTDILANLDIQKELQDCYTSMVLKTNDTG